MKLKETGFSGKKISKIGLGCATFGREIDKSSSFKMMDHAYSCGITFFDTATAYSTGNSELIVGEWLDNRRPASESVLVATKILPPYDHEDISNSVSDCLKRLNIEAIDLLYLHRWDSSLLNPDVFSSLGNQVAKGRVRMLGASNFTAEQFSKAVAVQKEKGFPAFRFIQNNNNLAVSDISENLIAFCDEQDISVVTYSPLGAGFLTGKHSRGVQPGTRFEIIPGVQDIYFNEKAYKRLARLQQIAGQTGYSTVHLALAWALHQPGVDSVLVGGRIPAHIDQALAAMAFEEPDIFKELEAG